MEQRDGDFDQAIELMRRHGTLAATLERAREYGTAARRALEAFRDGPERGPRRGHRVLPRARLLSPAIDDAGAASLSRGRRLHRYAARRARIPSRGYKNSSGLLDPARDASDRARASTSPRPSSSLRRHTGLRRTSLHIFSPEQGDDLKRHPDDRRGLGPAAQKASSAATASASCSMKAWAPIRSTSADHAAADLAQHAAGARWQTLATGALRGSSRPRCNDLLDSPPQSLQGRRSDALSLPSRMRPQIDHAALDHAASRRCNPRGRAGFAARLERRREQRLWPHVFAPILGVPDRDQQRHAGRFATLP